jgi:hypothetical protein
MGERMTIGFTGTQQGMTDAQKDTLLSLLYKYQPSEVIHGDCIGADLEFAVMCALKSPSNPKIHSRPCTIKSKRAYAPYDVIYSARAPLDRNQDIVDNSDILIACPKEDTEVIRSGTWSAVRRGRQKRIPVIVIYPNGLTERWN